MANENLSPAVMSRLMKEVRDYVKTPVEGITLQIQEDNLSDITFEIQGAGGERRGRG